MCIQCILYIVLFNIIYIYDIIIEVFITNNIQYKNVKTYYYIETKMFKKNQINCKIPTTLHIAHII